MMRLRGNSDATSCTQGLNLDAESKFLEIIDGEEAENDVFAEEVRDGARNAGAERGIGGSKDCGRNIPGRGSGGCCVRQRRCRRCQLVEAKVR